VNGEENTHNIEIWGRGHRLVLFNSDLEEVYKGSPQDDHRLYQEMVGGFAGMKALGEFGINPPIIHLNEGSSVFAAIAYMDNLVAHGASIEDALAATRAKTLMTNHTLVPAAWNRFSLGQLEKYVFPNLTDQSGLMKGYLTQFMKVFPEDKARTDVPMLDLGLLALEVSGKLNGVSVSHAEIASQKFARSDGSAVYFKPITNGMDADTWIDEEMMRYYRKFGLYDHWGMPTDDFEERVNKLSAGDLWVNKRNAKNQLLDYLQSGRKKDQYGRKIVIPEDAKIVVWPRRFADYKRPGMIFRDTKRLAQLMEKEKNAYFIIAGRAHPNDTAMRDEMYRILEMIDKNGDLASVKDRIIFIPEYDPELAYYLNSGADIALNTPIVGNEACGTSIFKQTGNNTLIVSTRDGGLSDAPQGSFLEIGGLPDSHEEQTSLYDQLERALMLAETSRFEEWGKQVKAQLQGMGRKVSGTRMLADYVNYSFPKKEERAEGSI